MHRAVGQALGRVALAGACLALACEKRQQIAYRELLDPDPQVRADSAVRLGQARAKDAVESLIELLDDPNGRVRAAAVWALGEIGDTRAVDALVRTCGDANVQVRLAACRGLGQLGDARAIPTLSGLLRDMDDRMRLAAARALAEIPGRESAEAIVTVLLEDDSEVIRQQSKKLLRRHDSAFARERLEAELRSGADPVARTHAACVLGELADPASKAVLVAALQDPHPGVRSRAGHALAGLDPSDPEARVALRRRVELESDPSAQIHLAWCLAIFGDRSQLETIRVLLASGAEEQVRAEAAMALGEVGDPADVPRLEAALHGDDIGLVRREAYVAIQKLKRG